MGGEIRYISSIEVNFVNPYIFVSQVYIFAKSFKKSDSTLSKFLVVLNIHGIS